VPHFLPPLTGILVVLRLRRCEPPLQVFVHLVHFFQAACLQSMGHAFELQADLRFLSFGQPLPPCTGGTSLRVSNCVPPPHVFVHLEGFDHLPTMHGSGLPRSPFKGIA